MKYLIVSAAVIAILLVGCEDDGGDEATATPAPAESATATTDAGFCNDEAVGEVVDLWVNSVSKGLAKSEDLTLEDEEGMRSDIESATRTYCEAGQFPTAEDSEAYCNAIVAAIDFRLDGPNDARNAFLTEYYDRCYTLDDEQASPTG